MGKLTTATALLVTMAAGLVLFMGNGFDPESVHNQTVLITGASTGIGEQLAYQYARLGARLMLTARREALLQNVAKTCEELGAPQVHFLAADMADPEDRARLLARAEEHLQGGLDHLVLNHATMVNNWWTGSAEDVAVLEKVMATNFLSYVDLASGALPMLTKNRGRIGVVSSIFGRWGTVKEAAYSSSKFALHGFFSSLRQELLRTNAGVSVTLAVLGPVASDTLVQLRKDGFEHLPTSLMSTTAEAARAILENVSVRAYSFKGHYRPFEKSL